MKRKIIGILLAVALATVGTFALVSYVQSAKDDAVAAERPVRVYVVDEAIPRSTPVADIKKSVKVVEVPAQVRATDAVTDLSALDGDLVAAVDLEPGEQLLTSRLVAAKDLASASVPKGLQEMTVSLQPARAVGGELKPGDTVGVVLSFEPFELNTSTKRAPDEPSTPDKSPNMTHLTFHKVLVTRIQFDQSETTTAENATNADKSKDPATATQPAPSNNLLVTLALSSSQVEQVAFAAEFGHIWLTAEGAGADESGTRIVTLGQVFGAEVPK
jgi:pilus assembly protein CpaB